MSVELSDLLFIVFQFDKVTKLTADAKFGKLSLYCLEKLELLGTLKNPMLSFKSRALNPNQSLSLRRPQAKKKLINHIRYL